ncbi:ABC-three component system middle component 2 [Priestia aryabhattai]|uniref:ABC-three component system middle component 2 n=1 Tax=Priestia TaxID=2800373 RepID=UPI002877635D|nr:ABC-three component system middle component 2 [Priestia megaterium]
MENIKLFNNPVEIGVRLLVILVHSKKSLDLQEIIYYDYLTTYFGDVDSNFSSLHPSNPLHSIEYIVRRRIIKEGLNIVAKKGLIKAEYSEKGIRYKASEEAEGFLSYFESNYYKQIAYYADLVSKRFNSFSFPELSNYFKEHIGHWKGEFEKEVLFRGGENG